MDSAEPKLACVIPTNRPEQLRVWLKAWEPLLSKHDVELIVVEDSEKTWKQLPDFIPQRTGSIRSWGFLQAYKEGYDVLTLDDDCMPTGDPIQAYKRAFRKYSVGDYFDIGHTFGLDEYMRGYPFLHRKCAYPLLQYGGWDNVPDLDAITQIEHEKRAVIGGYKFDRRVLSIPKNIGFTGCIMNVFIKNEALPMMYQLIMGEKVGYDRWDDIWSGLFAKKICDHLGIPILINGKASIIHTRASDTNQNLKKEQGGYELNESMWDNLKSVGFHSNTVIGCYEELTYQLNPYWFGEKGEVIIEGMKKWLDALS